MGRLPSRAAFNLNGHDAVGKESNGRKNGQTDAQGTVREAQEGDLPDVIDPSQARSREAPPSLQQASRRTRNNHGLVGLEGERAAGKLIVYCSLSGNG